MVGDSGQWGPLRYSSWEPLAERVERWARDVKEDVDTPDLWAQLQRQREFLGTARYDDVANTPFNENEQTEIARQLREITAYVKSKHELDEDQKRALEGTRTYLEDAARRVGRVDWRTAVAGALLGAVAGAILPPEPVRDMLVMLFRSLGHLLGHPFPELPSG